MKKIFPLIILLIFLIRSLDLIGLSKLSKIKYSFKELLKIKINFTEDFTGLDSSNGYYWGAPENEYPSEWDLKINIRDFVNWKLDSHDVNFVDQDGYNFLHFIVSKCSYKKFIDLAQLLVSRGICINRSCDFVNKKISRCL